MVFLLQAVQNAAQDGDALTDALITHGRIIEAQSRARLFQIGHKDIAGNECHLLLGAELTDFQCIAAFAQMFHLLMTYPDASGALWRTCILQTLWSIPYIFPAYYACEALPRRLG